MFGKTPNKVNCIEPHLHISQTSTDLLEKLATAIDVFKIHLTITRDCLIVAHLSELVLKAEDIFIPKVMCILNSVETRIYSQDHQILQFRNSKK